MSVEDRVRSWIEDLEEEIRGLQDLVALLRSRLLTEDAKESKDSATPSVAQPSNPLSQEEAAEAARSVMQSNPKSWRVRDLANAVMVQSGRPVSVPVMLRALRSGDFLEANGWWSLKSKLSLSDNAIDDGESTVDGSPQPKAEWKAVGGIPDEVRDATVIEGILDIMIRNPGKSWKPTYLVARLLQEEDISVDSDRILALLRREQGKLFEVSPNGWWTLATTKKT